MRNLAINNLAFYLLRGAFCERLSVLEALAGDGPLVEEGSSLLDLVEIEPGYWCFVPNFYAASVVNNPKVYQSLISLHKAWTSFALMEAILS